jgi:hypothetical protein
MPITISGSTGVAGVDGSQGNPALQGTDTNTGIYYGADVIYGSANGTQKLRVDSTGIYAPANAAAAIIGLTDAATIAVDMSLGNNFSVTLGGNRTLGNPTGLTAGQSGVIFITQDATGSRTLAYSSFWDFPNAVTPVLTTTASAVDVLIYTVRSSTSIAVNYMLNIG